MLGCPRKPLHGSLRNPCKGSNGRALGAYCGGLFALGERGSLGRSKLAKPLGGSGSVRLVGKGLKPREGVLLGIDLVWSKDDCFLQWEHGID